MFKSACMALYAPGTEHSAEVDAVVKRQPFREKILDFNKEHVHFQKNPLFVLFLLSKAA